MEAGVELTADLARAVLKDWMTFAKYMASSLTNLPELTAIEGQRFSRLLSARRKEVPTPAELYRISKATGCPINQLAEAAAELLQPVAREETIKHRPRPPSDWKLASRAEIKEWIRSARFHSCHGRLTQAELANRIGKSIASVTAWENKDVHRIPKTIDIYAIASVCGLPSPEIAFDRRIKALADSHVAVPVPPPPEDLSEEIIFNARLISAHASDPKYAERNAAMFRARYESAGDPESTLQAIGDAHALTRERVRQIIDKQMSFVPVIPLRSTCFEALADAIRALGSMSYADAEAKLRGYLGSGLSLQGAASYGREVLGRALPFTVLYLRNGEPIFIAGDQPEWLNSAVSHSKLTIRHSGAAQIHLVWALTMRQHHGWIDPDEFRRVLVLLPGFEWIDDDETWYWLGPEGCANRVVERALEILSFAKGALDIEIIYGGLTRKDRSRTSVVSEDAGIWPPMTVVRSLLAKSPDLVCQQGDDFRLSNSDALSPRRGTAAEAVIIELKKRGGIASRSELHQATVVEQGMNPITFSVALAKSPMLRQVDRSIFAIRGWPISAARFAEAQQRVGNQSGPLVNFKEVDVSSSGDVSWIGTISNASLQSYYAGVPKKAMHHLPTGAYVCEGATLTLTPDRFVGLIKLLLAAGHTAGAIYQVIANGRSRNVSWTVIGQDIAEVD